MHEIMRLSTVSKRTHGDVTTLAAQSNAFDQTNMSPKRFNQSIKARKKAKMQRASPQLFST